MKKKDFFELGKITKFNRKTSELTIRTTADNANDYGNTSIIFLEIEGGLVPFFISSIMIRDSKTIRVLVEDYASPEKAGQFVGCAMFLPKMDGAESDSDEFYFHKIIGFRVIDQTHGDIGILEDILDRPEQEILQINHHGKEILIPLADEIIKKLKHNKKQLFIHAPDGLIVLYLEG